MPRTELTTKLEETRKGIVPRSTQRYYKPPDTVWSRRPQRLHSYRSGFHGQAGGDFCLAPEKLQS